MKEIKSLCEINYQKQVDIYSLGSSFINAFPESTREFIYKVVRGEKGIFPSSPISSELAGFQANFWIKNRSDAYRIGNKNFEKGYSSDLIYTLASMDNPNFVDVGSAQGFYSIFAAKAGSRVVAIDPDPISQQSIKENLELNPDIKGFVETIEIALSDKTGEIPIYIDSSGSYAASLEKINKSLIETILVQTTSLDDLFSEGTIPMPDVVKIDVEGAEGLVLKGMRELFSKPDGPKHLFIELHGTFLPLFDMDEQLVLDLILSNGYSLDKCWERNREYFCHFTRKQGKIETAI